MTEFHHVSVLLEETLEALKLRPDGIYLDGTLGGAGHSARIAAQLTTGLLIGVDRDPEALAAAGELVSALKLQQTAHQQENAPLPESGGTGGIL